MPKLGFQSQLFSNVAALAADAAIFKGIDADHNTYRAAKAANANIVTIGRKFTGQAKYASMTDPTGYGRTYARATLDFHGDAPVDFYEPENEPPCQNGDDAKKLADFTFGFIDELAQSGKRGLMLNFGTGSPEVYAGGYTLYRDLWANLVPVLREGLARGCGMSLHEFGWPSLFTDYNGQYGFRIGRYRAVYDVLPPDLQRLPLYVTEWGYDKLIVGQYGGIWSLPGDSLQQMATARAETIRAVQEIYSRPQVAGLVWYEGGALNPWGDYDVFRDDESRAWFKQLMKDVNALVPPQPAPARVPFAAGYTVTQAFGDRPDYYAQFGLAGHEGVDLVPLDGNWNEGAVESGEVVRAGPQANYANYGNVVVVLNRATARAWWYCHMNRVGVSVGTTVQRGDNLGTMGATGNVSGPHLHLGLRYADAAGNPVNLSNGYKGFVDPLPVLTALDNPQPQGPSMITSQEIAEAFPFLATQALRHDLGEHIYGEVRKQAADGKTYILDGWAHAGIGVADGDFVPGHEFYFDPRNAFAISATPPVPTPSPTPQVKRLTTADLPYGQQVISYLPKPGELFWGLIDVGNYKFGVGTQFTVFTRNATGTVPSIPVTQAWDEANQRSATVTSDGNGTRNIIMGAGDDYTPGDKPPPDRIYVSKNDGTDREKWPTPLGDVLVTGQIGGHTEATLTFQLMTG